MILLILAFFLSIISFYHAKINRFIYFNPLFDSNMG